MYVVSYLKTGCLYLSTIVQEPVTRTVLMTWITMIVWSLTYSQTSWSIEIKWALGSITMIKVSGGDEIPVELFQILKDDTVKVLHSVCQQIWKIQQSPQDWKRSIPKKGNAKECSNYCTTALISHTSKIMFKILQECSNSPKCSKFFNSTWTENFQMFKLKIEKAEEPEN